MADQNQDQNELFAVIVDFQKDFVYQGAALPVPDAESLVQPMDRYLESLDPDKYDGVILTRCDHRLPGYLNSLEHTGVPDKSPGFPPHCLVGSWGWEFALDVERIPRGLRDRTYVLGKNVFDMWMEPEVHLIKLDRPDFDFKSSWYEHRDDFFDIEFSPDATPTVEISGLASDYCVFWAAQGFIDLGWHVELMTGLSKGIFKSLDTVCWDEWQGHERVKVNNTRF